MSDDIVVGARVRPSASHVATNHIGTVREVIPLATPHCQTCACVASVDVEWDSRRGEVFTWSPSKLEREEKE